ncbi:NAD(P)-dependent oxidoreductase [Secundilactobacillus paracollinoides]|uniref:NAD(P)-dependent oxidoreductase n=1 Tax=Secundilactobacillus paracollinoides TaxID=240427 RepID=UPI0006CFE416|nr:NAD(P)H-binding protein [Secundilactobacillus paracollinoides]KRL80779.1 NAD-dependent epimerase dehydratase [Secundilactobacillus paracollinoides DSM 15502 = JCM 11969]
MKIGVIGATGRTGQEIVKEAISRGHEVTAIVRSKDKAASLFGNQVTIIKQDALTLTHDDLSEFDEVVDAFASPQAYQHLDLASRLISAFRNDDTTNLFFILGASSLKQADGTMMLDTILKDNAGQPWIQTPVQQVHEYNYLQWIDNVNWTAISPQATFTPGPKTTYRIAKDEILLNKAGKSEVSTGNLASALLDEIEQPKHLRQRFTVVDD